MTGNVGVGILLPVYMPKCDTQSHDDVKDLLSIFILLLLRSR